MKSQMNQSENQNFLGSGLLCLRMIASLHGRTITREAEETVNAAENKIDYKDLLLIGKRAGLKTRLVNWGRTRHILINALPALAKLKSGTFVILARGPALDNLKIINPVERTERCVKENEIFLYIEDEIILVAALHEQGAAKALNGLRWFLDVVWKYRRSFAHIVLASFFINVLALVTPIILQVVIDKVMVHKGYATLFTLVFGLIVIGLIDVILQYLRSYLLSHTSNRIDVEIGQKAVAHLLRLPLSYFEARSTGQIVARIRELDNIRHILTGPALFAGLDLFFIFVFLVVIFIYSWKLSLIVVFSIPFYVVVALLSKGPLLELIKERFNRGALSQNLIVESIVGILSVKASAVESLILKKWEDRLGSYVRSSFDVDQLSNLARSFIQVISKMVSAIILLFGAVAVIDGGITIGEFVAFNMIASQISQPIIRISQLWQDLQQLQVSLSRVADIIDEQKEFVPDTSKQPASIRGELFFENVSFGYNKNNYVLKNLSFKILPGEIVGIIGPSGSGKSTIAKLIQRIHLPQEGRVFLDDTDVSLLNPYWLRRNVSTVLQESLMFNATIHENIALTNPNLPHEFVVNLAKMSGADEFIEKLPQGYSTMLEERGSNLSGGQRQRIAIARALGSNPKVVIFDEATSALDFESELYVQKNMSKISRGRTMLIISHRLSALNQCSRILAIIDGRLVEQGRPLDLLKDPNSFFYKLMKYQSQPFGVES